MRTASDVLARSCFCSARVSAHGQLGPTIAEAVQRFQLQSRRGRDGVDHGGETAAPILRLSRSLECNSKNGKASQVLSWSANLRLHAVAEHQHATADLGSLCQERARLSTTCWYVPHVTGSIVLVHSLMLMLLWQENMALQVSLVHPV